jgi:hypothetical protein
MPARTSSDGEGRRKRPRAGAVAAHITLLYAALVVGAACGGGTTATPSPKPETHPLAGIVGQNIIIAPVQALRMPADVGWPALPASRPTLAHLDSVFADTLKDRVGNRGWVYADGLVTAAANNPTYATDPRSLAVNSLRASTLKINDRLVEPLASQLRTMIAFQDARLVLIPTDLTIERTSAGLGQPVVHLVLVDPRSSVVRWIGRVTGNDSPAFTSDIPALIATRLADLFASR